MNWLDIIIAIPILYGLIRGLFKGAVLEIASLVCVIISLLAAKIYANWLAVYLQDWFNLSEKGAPIIAFIAIFFITLILVELSAHLLDKFLSALWLGCLNKSLGAIIGTVKFVLIMSVIINAFAFFNDKTSLIEQDTIENSRLYKPVKSVLKNIIPYIHTNSHNDDNTGNQD